MIDRPLSQRNTERLAQKQAIAYTALKYIDNMENIFLDGGTTLFEFANVLKNSDMSELHIITNFLPTISLLESSPKVKLVTLGGSYDESLKSFVGPLAKEALDSFYLDTAFISTTGMNIQQGLSCTNFQDAELRRQVMAKSKKKILLADSSKINRSAFITVAKLNSLDLIITDWEIKEENLNTFRSNGIEVVIAPER
jgi:Transcriptional regulators of sugar metabolism